VHIFAINSGELILSSFFFSNLSHHIPLLSLAQNYKFSRMIFKKALILIKVLNGRKSEKVSPDVG